MVSFTAKSSIVFEKIREEPYTTKDGREVLLDVWVGACAFCGYPFEAKTKHHPEETLDFEILANSTRFANITCPQHRLKRKEIRKRWRKAMQKSRRKLSDQDIAEIRKSLSTGIKPSVLSLVYPCATGTIYNIKYRLGYYK